MNKIKLLRECKKPEVIVVTPLSIGHTISRETRVTIQRNEIPYVWLSSEGNFNIPTNAQFALTWYKKRFNKLPPYYLMIDRDVTLGRGMIDKMVHALKKIDMPYFAYVYASFEFKGFINQKFPARPFDIGLLIQHNYISSNSLFKSEVVEKIGLVTDDQYKSLLDWAFLLKLFGAGYWGAPCPRASFVVSSTQHDISAGSPEDYHLKRERVIKDFVEPIREQFKKIKNSEQPIDDGSVTRVL